MTRYDDDNRVSLDARNFQSQEERPHIFLSIHHNSAALVRDMKDVQRMEVYYHEDIALNMSVQLMHQLSQGLGRNATEPDPSYYYVTRQTFAPAILYEMAFMITPLEYERSCDQITMIKAANAIGQGLIDTIF